MLAFKVPLVVGLSEVAVEVVAGRAFKHFAILQRRVTLIMAPQILKGSAAVRALGALDSRIVYLLMLAAFR